MLELSNGKVYLNAGEPAPFSCPECHSIVYFTTCPVIECQVCHCKSDKELFAKVQWGIIEHGRIKR